MLPIKPIFFAMMLALSTVSATSALAQDDRMQSISVTAMRLNSDELEANPQVYLRLPADFVVFSLTCQSSTRDVAERTREMSGQFDALLAWDDSDDTIELNGGEAGYEMIPRDTISFGEIYRSGYNNIGSFSLVLSVDVAKDETFDALKLRTNTMIDKLKTVGRTECFSNDDQFLGIRGVDKHRVTLLRRLNDEATSLREIFGAGQVRLTGLERRVVSQPSGSLTMDVFIPYTLSLELDK